MDTGIPQRNFGKSDTRISALGLGGHHLGAATDEKTAVEIVHRALDGGITFYDCCWEYNRGKSEDWLGKGLKGLRDRAFLMTKVCTHGRDASLAMQMLEQSLRRLQTDHLDLWQIHGVTFQNDPEEFIRPNGAAEALAKAKQQGKVRFTGFSGHKDPDLHLAMLDTGFAFDAVQMPLNPFDANFFSFEQKVLPVLTARGIAPLGMKPIGGHGEPVQKGIFTAEQLLRYAMSLPVATTISGVSEIPILEHNLRIAQSFTPFSPQEMDFMRQRAKAYAGDGRFELYKTSIKYDNPEARLAHDFPLDLGSVEVKQMVYGNAEHRPSVSAGITVMNKGRAGVDSRRAFLKGAAMTSAISVLPAVTGHAQNHSQSVPQNPVVPGAGGETGEPVAEFQVPRRPMGKTGLSVSILGVGGYHLGTVAGQNEVNNMVSKAIDHGINFFDNAWEYHGGTSEERVGTALKGKRDKAIVMTKVCTHGRKKDVAMQMLEESLTRLQTDHLDVWQVHEVVYYNDPEKCYAADGVLEALAAAKKQGKVRFVGFTGHKNPSIHLAMIEGGFSFDTVQMPLNPFDFSYRSFQREVLPVAVQRGMAVFGMKSMGGSGEMIAKGALTPTEALSFAMSLPGVSTTISGMDSMEVLDQNLEILHNFKPLAPDQLDMLRTYGKQFQDGRYELFKSTVKYDGDLGRQQHGYPTAADLPA